MIKIEFDKCDADELYKAQLNHPNPRIRKKLLAVYMKSQGITNKTICQICRVSWPTLLLYFQEYTSEGLGGMMQIRHRGHPSKLNEFEQEIKLLLVNNPPATLKEARAKIKEISGLERSVPQIWFFMRKLGLSTRKVCGVPGKADPEAQEAFKKTSLSRDSQKRKMEKEQSIS